MKFKYKIFWLLNARAAATANAKRRTEINFLSCVFLRGDNCDRRIFAHVIRARISITAWEACSESNVKRKEYACESFHSLKLRDKPVQ
nr:hypothetical protein [Pseudochryseolinea flava]